MCRAGLLREETWACRAQPVLVITNHSLHREMPGSWADGDMQVGGRVGVPGRVASCRLMRDSALRLLKTVTVWRQTSALAAGERLIVPHSPDSARPGSQSHCGQLALAPQQPSLCVADGRCPG